MIRSIAFIFVLLVPHAGYSQVSFKIFSGYGSQGMRELKTYLENYAESFPPRVRPVAVQSFPSYWNYGFDVRYSTPSWQFGTVWTFGSTGARTYYSDYSGYRGADLLASHTTVQIAIAKMNKFGDGRFYVSWDFRPGYTFGRVSIREYLHVEGDGRVLDDLNENYMRGKSFSLQPTVTVGGDFGVFQVSAFAGYQLDLWKGHLYVEDTQSASYYFQNNDFKLNWTGYRIGLSTGVKIRSNRSSLQSKVFLGIGAGLDYGGILGGQITVVALNRFGIFGGVGFNTNGVGANGGVRLMLRDHSRFRPYVMGMYGFNTVVGVKNISGFNRTYYGPSAGVGFDFGHRERAINFGVIVPLRKDDVEQYVSTLKANGIDVQWDPFPVMVSLGYRIGINR